MKPRNSEQTSQRRQLDWRGWITLAWVLWWGWAYCQMAVAVKGPQVLQWLLTIRRCAGL
jgi:hypothetical protein